jgi:hypothetical protein
MVQCKGDFMIIFVTKKTLKRMECIMSQFLDDFRAALEKVAVGNGADEETKAAVVELKTKLAENDSLDAEQSTAIQELVDKLAASTPPAA